MMHDATADLYFGEPNLADCLDTAFAVIDADCPGVAIGRAFAVPFAFGIPGSEDLPSAGWDGVSRWAHEDRMRDRPRTSISALEMLGATLIITAPARIYISLALSNRTMAFTWSQTFGCVTRSQLSKLTKKRSLRGSRWRGSSIGKESQNAREMFNTDQRSLVGVEHGGQTTFQLRPASRSRPNRRP